MLCNPKRDAAIQVSNKLALVKVVKWINDSRNHKSIQDAPPPPTPTDDTRFNSSTELSVYIQKRQGTTLYIHPHFHLHLPPPPPPTPRFDIAKFNWLKVQFSIIIPNARYWYLSYNDENDKKKKVFSMNSCTYIHVY